MFRPCWVIFRENSLVTLLDALIQVSENVPLLSSSVVRRLVLYNCVSASKSVTDYSP
jgi:hypothetical protein